MKNIILLIVDVLFTGLGFSQNGGAIQPYRENDYTIAEAKNFLMGSSELSKNYLKEFLRIVNTALEQAGESIRVDENNIFWVLDNVQYAERILKSFMNSKRVGNQIQFFADKNFQGTVAIFKYGKCELILFKPRCLNLLEVSVETAKLADIPQNAPIVNKQQTPDFGNQNQNQQQNQITANSGNIGNSANGYATQSTNLGQGNPLGYPANSWFFDPWHGWGYGLGWGSGWGFGWGLTVSTYAPAYSYGYYNNGCYNNSYYVNSNGGCNNNQYYGHRR